MRAQGHTWGQVAAHAPPLLAGGLDSLLVLHHELSRPVSAAPYQTFARPSHAHLAAPSHVHPSFDWDAIVSRAQWVHATGITPLCGPGPLSQWNSMLGACETHDVPFTIDYNHRPALGSFEDLFSVVRPWAEKRQCRALILSLTSLRQFAGLLGLPTPPPSRFEARGGHLVASADEDARDATGEEDPRWSHLLSDVARKLGSPLVACCFKVRIAVMGSPAVRWYGAAIAAR